MAYPESIGLQATVDVPLELTAGKEGEEIAVPAGAATVAVPIPGGPGDVMMVTPADGDVAFQVGDAQVLATSKSNQVYRNAQVLWGLPTQGKPCTHISFFGKSGASTVNINCYRRGT